MKMLAEVTVHPLEGKSSHAEYIAECFKIFDELHLHPKLHAHGTNLEGEVSDVLLALERCHHRLHEIGIPRLALTVKMETRTDRKLRSEDRIKSVSDCAKVT